VTKTLQYVKLDKHIKLIDSPGVLFSIGKDDEDLVLRNVLKAEQLTDPVGVVSKIVAKCKPEQLCQVYKIEAYSSADDFLQKVAVKRGKLKKGGVPDSLLAAKSVILDWNSGKIPFYSEPPTTTDIQSSEIVSTWNKEFDVDSVIPKSDEEAFASTDNKSKDSFAVVPSSGPAPMGLEEVEEKIKQREAKRRTKAEEETQETQEIQDDAMSEEDSEEEKKNIVVRPPKTSDLPPNQDPRKKQKKQKKLARKAQRRQSVSEGEVSASMTDEAYDFASDFTS